MFVTGQQRRLTVPKRKAPEPDPDAFERMARELGCDETGEAFERALAKVLPPRRAPPRPEKPQEVNTGTPTRESGSDE